MPHPRVPALIGLQPIHPGHRGNRGESSTPHYLDDSPSSNKKNVPWDARSNQTSGSATSSNGFASHSDLSILSSTSAYPFDHYESTRHNESGSDDDKESRRDLKFWRFATKKKVANPRIPVEKGSNDLVRAQEEIGFGRRSVLKKKYKSTSDMVRLAQAPPPPLPGEIINGAASFDPGRLSPMVAPPVPSTPVSLFQSIPTDVDADDTMDNVAVPFSVPERPMFLTADFYDDTAELRAIRVPHQTKPAQPDPSAYLAPPASAPVIGYTPESPATRERKQGVSTPKSNRHVRWYGKGKCNYDASESFLDF